MSSFPIHSALAPVVTAEKYLSYKRKNGHFKEFPVPETVLVCYQKTTLDHLLSKHQDFSAAESFSNLYLVNEPQVGILGGWGIGAPALSNKLEQLVALGTKRFIAVGTAGSLMSAHQIGDFIIASKALAEDGVAHLYLKGERFSFPSSNMPSCWDAFSKAHSLPAFHNAVAWSFSAIFRETPEDIVRVKELGCDIVEMESATLYAIGQEKNVEALSLFVISDTITLEEWSPHIKEPLVRHNLNLLSEWAVQFCLEMTCSVKT